MATPNKPGALESRYRQKTALELRMKGLTFQEIGDSLGCSASYVTKIINKALKEITRGPAEDYLTLELLRLDKLQVEACEVLTRFHPVVSHGRIVYHDKDGYPLQDDSVALSAIDRLLRISERRSKLLGMDKPEKKEVTGANGEPLFADKEQRDEHARLTREKMLAELGDS